MAFQKTDYKFNKSENKSLYMTFLYKCDNLFILLNIIPDIFIYSRMPDQVI